MRVVSLFEVFGRRITVKPKKTPLLQQRHMVAKRSAVRLLNSLGLGWCRRSESSPPQHQEMRRGGPYISKCREASFDGADEVVLVKKSFS